MTLVCPHWECVQYSCTKPWHWTSFIVHLFHVRSQHLLAAISTKKTEMDSLSDFSGGGHHVPVERLHFLSTLFLSFDSVDPEPAAPTPSPRLLPPAALHCWPGPQLLYCPYLHVCVRACVSSCTHTQLMKSKCLDAVVTAVRPSQFLRPEATAGAGWSTCERNDTQISELMFSFINCLQQFIKHYLRCAFHSCNWCSACHFLQMRRSRLSLLLLSTHLRFSSQHLYSNYLIIHTDLLFRLCPAHLSH